MRCPTRRAMAERMPLGLFADRADALHFMPGPLYDGRTPNVDLAEAVRPSPSTCLRRTKALEEDGVLAGYRADLTASVSASGRRCSSPSRPSTPAPPPRWSRSLGRRGPTPPRCPRAVSACRSATGLPT
ncbi:Lrp/AsnC family transcriptional regulator [Streptomyces chartreusis]